MSKVGIIGGSGFIGSYVTKKFLNEGYQVKVGTVDLSKKDKYKHLHDLPNSEKLEIIELNVLNMDQLDSFLDGCSIIIHGGTPFQLEVSDPEAELFKPTIEGTKNFLQLVKTKNEIMKVVFIASVAAFNTDFPLLPPTKSDSSPITEADKPYMSNESHPYAQAKFLANEMVEKFINENSDLSFSITTVSPVGVMGKALSDREDSTSMGLQYLFKNKIAPNPFIQMFYDNDIYFALVDVEDVAEGVFKAAIKENLHGKNYLLTSESYRVSDISLMLNNEEPNGEPAIVYDNKLAKDELKMSFKPAKIPLNSYSK